MSTRGSMEERVRSELDRIRAEAPPVGPVPREVLVRARRGMALTVALAVLGATVVVTGSALAWRSFTATPPPRPLVPATEGPDGSPATGSEGPAIASASTREQLALRPLALPPFDNGGVCPTTPMLTIRPGTGTGFSTGTGRAQRGGAVYLVSGPVVRLDGNPRDGWYGVKDIWVVDGAYQGPVLIRGARIGQRGIMRLQFNPTLPQVSSLLLDGSSPSLQWDPTTHWWSVPSEALVHSPGCYAYQVDGFGFSARIVFQATR